MIDPRIFMTSIMLLAITIFATGAKAASVDQHKLAWLSVERSTR